MNYKAELTEVKNLAPNIIQLDFKLIEPRTLEFKAGQFLALIVGEKIKRFYSIITLPEQKDSFSFCVDLSPNGVGSKYIEKLKAGDVVELEGPYGQFVFKSEESKHLFVATGVGVAPFASIIPDALKSNQEKKLKLLFGVRNDSNSFYFEYFKKLADEHGNFEFVPCLSQADDKWVGYHGRVTSYMSDHEEDLKESIVYICGGVGMVKDVRALCLEKGHDPQRIKVEVFT